MVQYLLQCGPVTFFIMVCGFPMKKLLDIIGKHVHLCSVLINQYTNRFKGRFAGYVIRKAHAKHFDHRVCGCRAFRSAGKREAEKGNEMLFRTFTLWCFGRFSNHSKVIEIDNG